MNPSLLIVGAGFLGTEIARQALPFFHLTTTTKSGGDDHLPCDLGDPQSVAHLAKILPAPDFVIHCASSGRGGPEAYRQVFLDGTQHLRQTFPNAHLLFTSSTSVYHQTEGETVDESSPTDPIRETSQILLDAEKIVLDSGGTVARLAGLYGPDRSVILRKFLDGTAVIEEDGRRILNQIHVADAASALLHLINLQAPGLFNLADSTPLSQLECYQQLAQHFNRPLPPHGPKNTSRKRAWTHKKVLNTKLLATAWHPQFPSFLHALDSL